MTWSKPRVLTNYANFRRTTGVFSFHCGASCCYMAAYNLAAAEHIYTQSPAGKVFQGTSFYPDRNHSNGSVSRFFDANSHFCMVVDLSQTGKEKATDKRREGVYAMLVSGGAGASHYWNVICYGCPNHTITYLIAI